MTKLFIERSTPILDMEVNRSGDGRTVTAYCATFDSEYFVSDIHGEYDESITRTAFNRELGRGFGHVAAVYHHGMTLHGTPASGDTTRPIGTVLDVKPDGHGLLTVTRYANTPLGEELLELVRSGALKFQSFRGPIYSTAPVGRSRNGNRLLVRTGLGLREYGPTMFPVNAEAAMVAVRSTALAEQISALPADAREALAQLILPTPQETPHQEATEPAEVTPLADGTEPGQEAPLDDDLSIELAEMTTAIRRRQLTLSGETK